jgi:hypothetical protein
MHSRTLWREWGHDQGEFDFVVVSCISPYDEVPTSASRWVADHANGIHPN